MAKTEPEATEPLTQNSDDEVVDDPEPDTGLTPIAADMYGATLVSTVLAIEGSRVELIVAWLRMFANIVLQLAITFAVWKYINKDKMSTFYPLVTKADVYVTRLNEIISNPEDPLAYLDITNNATDAAIVSLCNSLPRGFFLLVVWFLWSAKIVTELASSYSFAQQVIRVPVKSQVKVEEGKGDAVNVMSLTTGLKALFVAFLVVPKFVIGVLLWWTGTEFLALATDMSGLILKVFTLQFVLTLDELLFEAFLATANKGRIKSSKINDYKVPPHPWINELMKFIVCICLMVFSHYYFLDIQQVRGVCWSCVRNCDNHCSAAFDYCAMDRA